MGRILSGSTETNHHLTPVYTTNLASFCQMGMMENQHPISAASQWLAALIGVFCQGGGQSPSQNTMAQWGDCCSNIS